MHFPTKRLQRNRPHPNKDKGLVLIAAYKFLLALLFALVGLGALHFLHKDIEDVLSTLAEHLRFNPESRFVNFVLDKASLIDDPLLRRIGAAAFFYSVLGLVEGIGLYMEKAWGEYLTLIITASFLPLEIFEMLRKLTWVRMGLLVINLLVLLYLLKMVMERGQRRSRSAETQGSPQE
jgi:uncharacterized membrane protein (DUF2068 family)